MPYAGINSLIGNKMPFIFSSGGRPEQKMSNKKPSDSWSEMKKQFANARKNRS